MLSTWPRPALLAPNRSRRCGWAVRLRARIANKGGQKSPARCPVAPVCSSTDTLRARSTQADRSRSRRNRRPTETDCSVSNTGANKATRSSSGSQRSSSTGGAGCACRVCRRPATAVAVPVAGSGRRTSWSGRARSAGAPSGAQSMAHQPHRHRRWRVSLPFQGHIGAWAPAGKSWLNPRRSTRGRVMKRSRGASTMTRYG